MSQGTKTQNEEKPGASLARLHGFWLGAADVLLQDGENAADVRESMLTVAITSKIAADGPRETMEWLKGALDLLRRESDEMERRRAEDKVAHPRH